MKKLFFIMTFSALVASCGNDMPVVELPEIDTTNPLLAEWDYRKGRQIRSRSRKFRLPELRGYQALCRKGLSLNLP